MAKLQSRHVSGPKVKFHLLTLLVILGEIESKYLAGIVV